MSDKVVTITKEIAAQSQISDETLIALHETDGIGHATIRKIIQYAVRCPYPLLKHASDLREADWRDMGLLPNQCAAVSASLRPEAVLRRSQRHAAKGISVMTYLDERYSPLLREISDPPWVLYFKGRWELMHREAIAIVGTRLMTAYGRKAAEELAAGCARRMTVVSGLARGIDTAAHRGALGQPCGTIAVLASPVDHIYPPDNRQLYRDIAERGLLLSETVPDTPLQPWLFPLRNRIIAGLSRGVVVVEAAAKSGALITADLALGYHRDVFIVPGPITSPRSRGALNYFRKGAHPVLDESDIFQAYSHLLPEQTVPNLLSASPGERQNPQSDMTSDERAVYAILLDGPRSIDELAAESGMTFGLLHAVLLSLTIKRRIHQQPGSVYNVL